MARRITFLLFFAAFVMTACNGSLGLADPAVTSASPSASEINAAAERVAAGVNIQAEDAAKEADTEISPADAPSADPPLDTKPASTTGPTDPSPAETATESEPETNRRVDVGEIGRFPQLIPFDGIRPVYEPVFASAEEAPLDDSELIIGIALDGEAKAYPITVLRFREMVNDEMAGIPTLVTW
jgi:hypothetical protein